MIKIEIECKDKAALIIEEVKAWCIEHIGPAVPRGRHNQKRRKLWSVKTSGGYFTKIQLFVRRPQDQTLAALKWK